MKEKFEPDKDPQQPNQPNEQTPKSGGLTEKPNSPKLGAQGGIIFMADGGPGNPENPQGGQKPPEPKGPPQEEAQKDIPQVQQKKTPRKSGPVRQGTPQPPENPQLHQETTPANSFASLNLKDKTLNQIVTSLTETGESADLDYLKGQIGILRSLLADTKTRIDRAEAGQLLNLLEMRRLEEQKKILEEQAKIRDQQEKGQEERQRQYEKYSGYTLYLTMDELKLLEVNPIEWLDKQFDTLYRMSQEGQELSSPVANNIQNTIGTAVRFLQNRITAEIGSQRDAELKRFEDFQKIYTNRFNLLAIRTVIGLRNIGAIKERAAVLQAHGLLYGFGMEDGKVSAMFNRLHELAEDKRLTNPEQHVTPEHIYELQTEVIDEQFEQAIKLGVGFFAPGASGEPLSKKEEDEIRANITRAVRTAYDVFVSSQRQAVIVARGKHLSGDAAYFSDPSSGPLNVYNLESLLTEKFDVFNAHDYEFLKRIKLALTEGDILDQESKLKNLKLELQSSSEENKEEKVKIQEEIVRRARALSETDKLERGTKLFRDLFAVPDFFSSGWRIQGILESIQERFKADLESASSSAKLTLFSNLQKTNNVEERKNIWEKIAQFRPEDALKIFQEKDGSNKDLEKLFNEPALIKLGIKSYKDLIKEGGLRELILSLRENGYRELREIDIATELTEKEKVQIKDWLLEAKTDELKNSSLEDIQTAYQKISEFIKTQIPYLLDDAKFNDIYHSSVKNEYDKNVIDAKAGDFALFMRLKKASDPVSRKKIWGKIAKFRPEEVLRIFQERNSKNSSFEQLLKDDSFKTLGIENYEQLKKTLGPLIRLLRDKGYQELRQLNIGEEGFTEQEKEIIKKFFEGEDKSNEIKTIFTKMSKFSSEHISELIYEPKFQDIYTRTILIDDALLDKLENPHFTETGRNFTPLSKKWAADQGGDAYTRIWNDTENAGKAAGALIGFIKAEEADHKFKSALEFAEATSQYNGQGARAKCTRYTVGTFLELSKSNFIWDLLGVSKLPFRLSMSELERIYGPQAKPMSRDELRKALDKIHLVLIGEITKKIRSGEETDPKKIKEEEEKVEKMYRDLEKVLEVTTGNKVKMGMLRFLIMLLLGITVEVYGTGKAALYGKK